MIVLNNNEVQMSISLKIGIAKFPVGKSKHLDVPEIKAYVESMPGLSIIAEDAAVKPEPEVVKEDVVTKEEAPKKPKKRRRKKK